MSRATIAEENAVWPAMLNQGSHPTLPGGRRTVEIYLLGFDGDLYIVPCGMTRQTHE